VPSELVPKDIRDFVSRHLPSIDHLEALVLLHRDPTRSWSPPELAAELRISDSAAEVLLVGLASQSFLDVKISNDILFRFDPVSLELENFASRCADFYARERIAMLNLVG
jgi:hypothetical protein